MNKIKEIKGKRFGRLLVIDQYRDFDKKITFCKCQCDCGTIKVVRSGNLVNKTTFSCGCLQKELLSKRSKKIEGYATYTAVINYYKRNARNRNIEWILTREEAIDLITDNCFYCGSEPSNISSSYTKYGDFTKFNGIDRINNYLPYTVENTVSCCKFCNFYKHTSSIEEFKERVKKLHEHLFREKGEIVR